MRLAVSQIFTLVLVSVLQYTMSSLKIVSIFFLFYVLISASIDRSWVHFP